MAAVVAQLIIAVFVLYSIAGCSDVLRVVGNSVQLDINGSVSEFDDYLWELNKTITVLKYNKKHKDITHSRRYKDRVEFKEETCSLILKNLQKTDSGLYEVKASSAEHTSAAVYRLSVLDPVESPVLTYQNSSDPCNITVTCSGNNLSISSQCYNQTCEGKEVKSGGITLSLSIKDIICNLSNPVSWKQAEITFKSCDNGENNTQSEDGQWPWMLYIVVGVLTLLILIVLGVICIYKKKKKGNAPIDCDNTVYQDVRGSAAAPTTLEMASTVYSTVQPTSSQTTELQQPKIPVGSMPSNTYESVPEQIQSQPETIYATVQKRQN